MSVFDKFEEQIETALEMRKSKEEKWTLISNEIKRFEETFRRLLTKEVSEGYNERLVLFWGKTTSGYRLCIVPREGGPRPLLECSVQIREEAYLYMEDFIQLCLERAKNERH